MTKHDVKEYLTKIYNLPVRSVRMEVCFVYSFAHGFSHCNAISAAEPFYFCGRYEDF